MVSGAGDTDRAVTRQVDEVLRRFDEASPNLAATRIDPSEPASLGEFERLLADLRWTYAARVEQYDRALDDGEAALDELLGFAREEAGGLAALASALPDAFEGAAGLQRRAQLLGLLADEGDAVVAEIRSARRVDDDRPLPDYEAARSILATALGQWAQELSGAAELLRQLAGGATAEPRLQEQVLSAAERYERRAERLAVAADPLVQFPPLELATIGRRLQEGHAAVLMGPRGATVIAGDQLVPKSNLKVGAASVSFDQRFRGEQLLASAVRSLMVDRMPLVVFVHAEDRSLLQPDDRDVDLVGVWEQLDASRYQVAEWIVHQGARPVADADQRVVWVIVPPPQRAGLAVAAPEQRLLEETGRLLAEGEPVLLSLYPSIASRYGRRDPWMALTPELGLEVDTSSVIFEAVRLSEEQRQVERGQALRQYPADHPIARAVQGQQSYVSLPMPVRPAGGGASDIRHTVVAEVAPGPDRWLERDWMQAQVEPPSGGERLEAAAPIVVATERPSPADRSRQRIVTVGSGGWMLSYVADVAVNVGGDRFALVNPGNHELMLSSVAWLAGMDDLIAAGPSGRQVSRLQGIGTGASRGWFWLTIVGLPGLCVACSMLVWLTRRT
jgi:hypothetical protein